MSKSLCPRGASLVTLALAALLASLAACSGAAKTKPVVVQPLIQAQGQKSITVADDKSGAAVVLDRDQALIVRLPVTAPFVYEWSLVDLKPGVLLLHSAVFERAALDVNAEESAGAMVWRLRGEAPGSVGLRFELRRPRNVAAAVRVVDFAVTVK